MIRATTWRPEATGWSFWRQAKDYAGDLVYKAIDECGINEEEGWEIYWALVEKTGGEIVSTSEMMYDLCTEENGCGIRHLHSAITKEGSRRYNTENMELIISVYVEHLDEEDATATSAAIDTFDDLYDGNIKGMN